MFRQRDPGFEEKVESVNKKKKNSERIFSHLQKCRQLSLHNHSCYLEHGNEALQCRRDSERENLCWGYLLCPEAMENFLGCMKSGKGVSGCMGEANALGQGLQEAIQTAQIRQQNVSALDKQMAKACHGDELALSECLKEEGDSDSKLKCKVLQRKHALCVASFKCPQVKNRLVTCLEKSGRSPTDENYLRKMHAVPEYKDWQQESDLKTCRDEELDLDTCLIDASLQQWEMHGVPVEEYSRVNERETGRMEEGI